MTSPTCSTGPYKRPRSAFTLVELLVVITVIGILVGLLLVGLGPVMVRTNEFAISNEIQQMEASMEKFRTDYGFYPPSFETFGRLASDTDRAIELRRYLNRIAPNHSYSIAQLEDWWDQVGNQMIAQNITNGDVEPFGADLVFWLSGISTNKQLPLGDPTAWNATHAFGTDSFERNVFFDFDSSRLQLSADMQVAGYRQARGPEVNYRFYSNYDIADMTGYLDTNGNFFSPDTFQLVAAGRDGTFGNPGVVSNAGQFGQDDMCNFAEGTLQRVLFNRQ